MTSHITESVIDRVLDHGAPDITRATLLEHLDSCAECRTRWEDALTAHAALATQQIEIPAGLASRAVSTAVQARVERLRSRRRPFLEYAAVLLVGIALGALAERSRTQTTMVPTPSAAQAGYLFVFSGTRAAALSAEDRAAIVRSFRSWTDSLRQTGQLIAVGQLTRDAPRLVSATEPNLDSATVRAFASMEGFYVLLARDEEDALALARGCPYLRFGGTIVVRRRAGGPQNAVRVSMR
jgi:hypothetical protein